MIVNKYTAFVFILMILVSCKKQSKMVVKNTDNNSNQISPETSFNLDDSHENSYFDIYEGFIKLPIVSNEQTISQVLSNAVESDKKYMSSIRQIRDLPPEDKEKIKRILIEDHALIELLLTQQDPDSEDSKRMSVGLVNYEKSKVAMLLKSLMSKPSISGISSEIDEIFSDTDPRIILNYFEDLIYYLSLLPDREHITSSILLSSMRSGYLYNAFLFDEEFSNSFLSHLVTQRESITSLLSILDGASASDGDIVILGTTALMISWVVYKRNHKSFDSPLNIKDDVVIKGEKNKVSMKFIQDYWVPNAEFQETLSLTSRFSIPTGSAKKTNPYPTNSINNFKEDLLFKQLSNIKISEKLRELKEELKTSSPSKSTGSVGSQELSFRVRQLQFDIKSKLDKLEKLNGEIRVQQDNILNFFKKVDQNSIRAYRSNNLEVFDRELSFKIKNDSYSKLTKEQVIVRLDSIKKRKREELKAIAKNSPSQESLLELRLKLLKKEYSSIK